MCRALMFIPRMHAVSLLIGIHLHLSSFLDLLSGDPKPWGSYRSGENSPPLVWTSPGELWLHIHNNVGVPGLVSRQKLPLLMETLPGLLKGTVSINCG